MMEFIANFDRTAHIMIYCFPSVNDLAETITQEFLRFVMDASSIQKTVHVALSGGNTPRVFFEALASICITRDVQVPFKSVHFFWVDERCVAPDHHDSNYGMTRKSLLSKIGIDNSNIHRIRGEDNPRLEAIRYANEINHFVEVKNGIPLFDWIFLGIGEDGHTASIFPDRMDLLDVENLCEAVIHPSNGQFRITLTGKPIRQAKRITFLATGTSKSTVIRQIMNNEPDSAYYPAAQIHLGNKFIDWYMDKEAAQFLKITCRGKHQKS